MPLPVAAAASAIAFLSFSIPCLGTAAARTAAFMKALGVSSAMNWAEGVWPISSACPPMGKATTGTPISSASYTA